MDFDLAEFDKRVSLGLIRKVIKGDLVLYNYTDKCTYEKAWDKYTRAARGIIFDSVTKRLIARPFPKFFNLGEMEETYLSNLPDTPYQVTEKVDGSLGIIYSYKDEWHVATRGAFDSEQAVKAREILKKYDTSDLFPGMTYLVEIIYPDNKIVVNYGNEEKLVYLTSMNLAFDFDIREDHLPFSYPNVCNYTINEMIELQKTMPKDQEGFVVKYPNNLRVKIKGHEYLKIHKMISCMSPLSFWESMEDGIVNREYIQQLPEEFRAEFEPMVEALESHYRMILEEINNDTKLLPTLSRTNPSKEELKQIGIMTQSSNHGLKHPGAMFPFVLNNIRALNRYVMKLVRPDGNTLKYSVEQPNSKLTG